MGCRDAPVRNAEGDRCLFPFLFIYAKMSAPIASNQSSTLPLLSTVVSIGSPLVESVLLKLSRKMHQWAWHKNLFGCEYAAAPCCIFMPLWCVGISIEFSYPCRSHALNLSRFTAAALEMHSNVAIDVILHSIAQCETVFLANFVCRSIVYVRVIFAVSPCLLQAKGPLNPQNGPRTAFTCAQINICQA